MYCRSPFLILGFLCMSILISGLSRHHWGMAGWNGGRIGNRAGLGGATPTPFPSQLYKSISHPRPIPEARWVNGIPSLYFSRRGGYGASPCRRDHQQHLPIPQNNSHSAPAQSGSNFKRLFIITGSAQNRAQSTHSESRKGPSTHHWRDEPMCCHTLEPHKYRRRTSSPSHRAWRTPHALFSQTTPYLKTHTPTSYNPSMPPKQRSPWDETQ